MSKIEVFEELEIWQLAREISNDIRQSQTVQN